MSSNTDGLGPGPITGYGPTVNDERPLTAASQRLQDKLVEVLGWDVVLSDQMTADLHAIEQEAALRAEATRDEGLDIRATLDQVAAVIDDPARFTEVNRLYRSGWVDALRAVGEDLNGRTYHEGRIYASSPEPVPSEPDQWHEPDGTPVEPGLHPHYAMWDHEGRKWDLLPTEPVPSEDGLDVERLAAAMEKVRTYTSAGGHGRGPREEKRWGVRVEQAAEVAAEYERLSRV